jgi:methyl-accepting chemotaxis protein
MEWFGMRLYVAVPLSIIAGVGTVLAVLAFIAIGRSSDTVQWSKHKDMLRVGSLISEALRTATSDAVAQAELVAGMPGVSEAMARSDRDWLKSILPAFQQQRAKYGAEGLTFLTPPALTLIRLDDPGRFGDDQSASRPMLLAVSRLRESQGGLDVSRNSVGLRGVAPVSFENRLAGLVEWRVGLFGLARQMNELTEAEITIFFNRDRLVGNRAAEERQVGEMSAMASTSWGLTSALILPEDLKPVNAIKIDFRTLRGSDYAMVYVPLFDFAGDRVGTVLAVAERNEFAKAEHANRTILFTVVIAGTLVCSGLVLVVLRTRLLRPMSRLAERAQRLATGDFTSPVPDRGRTDEVGVHAAALESLRQSLLKRRLLQQPPEPPTPEKKDGRQEQRRGT